MTTLVVPAMSTSILGEDEPMDELQFSGIRVLRGCLMFETVLHAIYSRAILDHVTRVQ